MEPEAVVRRRLRSQLLRGPGAVSPEAALRTLLAVQAQEFPYARWSLAQRVSATVAPAVTAADIEQAVADGRILRTHILRPTWHFVHRDDLRWLLALSAPRLEQANAATYRHTGIDAAVAARSAEVLAGAVAGGNHLSRDGLAASLHDAGFPAKGLQLAYLIMHAEISGILVSGTPIRSAGGALKQTYALFDERVPARPEPAPGRPEALAELTRRYFTSRGPATVKDCADWSGLTMTDVRKGLQLTFEAHPEALAETVIDGVVLYFDAGGLSAGTPDAARAGAGGAGAGGLAVGAGDGVGGASEARPRIDLIQCYDEYVMGYSAHAALHGRRRPGLPVQGRAHACGAAGRADGRIVAAHAASRPVRTGHPPLLSHLLLPALRWPRHYGKPWTGTAPLWGSPPSAFMLGLKLEGHQ
jgi:hypothetical protein